MELIAVLQEHIKRYPLLQPQDLVKLLYQNEFGGGHLVSSAAEAIERIKAELESLDTQSAVETSLSADLCEDIGSDLCRFHLRYLCESGLRPETLGRLFFLSAAEIRGSKENFRKKLAIARQACANGNLSFDANSFANYLAEYLAQEITHPGHSSVFRKKYSPAYRVISKRFCLLLGLFTSIDALLAQNNGIRIALEGNSGAGKSVLAKLLQDVYGGNVFHMDDFFLRPQQRTAARFAQIGGNIDYERFQEDVLAGLDSGDEFSYRKFDCRKMALTEKIKVKPQRINVIEGVYSLHPQLGRGYDLKVFLTIDDKPQRKRILRRNGPEMLQRFMQEWIPLENEYFSTFSIKEKCDLTISGQDL